MSTTEDFENAPVGATATDPRGRKAVKMAFDAGRWELENGWALGEYGMCKRGFTLDPAPAPTTAREALALAWELAHPVKAGQIIPEDAEFIHLSPSGKYSHFKTRQGGDAVSAQHAHEFRTLDPLPDPEPAWLDAPAVLASMDECSWQKVWVPKSGGNWTCTCCGTERHWSELEDVTPLYPEGKKA